MPPKNEKTTRKELIDVALTASGWFPILPYENHIQYALGAVEEYSTQNGPADYVLFSQNRPIAIVEAKKQAVGPQNVSVKPSGMRSGLNVLPLTSMASGYPLSTPKTAKSYGSRI